MFADNKPGYLELGIKNEIGVPVSIRLRDRIGKVCFFNVSDTYPIGRINSASMKRDYERRSSSEPPSPYGDQRDDYEAESFGDSLDE